MNRETGLQESPVLLDVREVDALIAAMSLYTSLRKDDPTDNILNTLKQLHIEFLKLHDEMKPT